jgi:hypothetical protein
MLDAVLVVAAALIVLLQEYHIECCSSGIEHRRLDHKCKCSVAAVHGTHVLQVLLKPFLTKPL